MPKSYCFICASDEGIFMDITADSKESFYNKLETCFFIKAKDVDTLSKKICHKCAYELDQCYSFVQKYKQLHQTTSVKKIPDNCCILCLEPGKKGYIFDLSKDNSFIHNPFHKLCQLFKNNFQKYQVLNKLICLTCRYTLDVLFDLKTVFHKVGQKERIVVNECGYSNFSKIKTIVVNRKTTITESTRCTLHTSSDSDSDLSIMARGHTRASKLNNNKTPEKSKLRNCDKCHNEVKNGEDMYRLYRTGLTVCKICWITMDPNKRIHRKRPKFNSKKIKLCSVFLKDILTDATYKKEKVYRIEQDDQGNKVFIVTDEMSESESISHKISDANKTSGDEGTSDVLKPGEKRYATSLESESTDTENKPNKKQKSDQKQRSKDSNNVDALKGTAEAIQVTDSTLTRQKAKQLKSNQNSDSDTSVSMVRSSENIVLTRRRKASGLSVSDAEVENRRNRKKLKIIFEGITVARNLAVSDETSSTEYRQTSKRKGRFASVSPVGTRISNHTKDTRSSKTRSNSISSRDTTQRTTSKLRRLESSKAQKPMAPKEEVKESLENKIPYMCGQCGIHCETKVLGMKHKLSHFKQPELKLCKVEIPTIKVELDTLGTSDQVDKLYDDQSDEIAINVEDDEEESVTLVPTDLNDKDVTIPVNRSSDKLDLSEEKAENMTDTADTTETEKGIEEAEKTDTVTDSTNKIEKVEDTNISPVDCMAKSELILKLSTTGDDGGDPKENIENESNKNNENNKEGNNDKDSEENKSNEQREGGKDCKDNVEKEDDQNSTEPSDHINDMKEADKPLEESTDYDNINSVGQLESEDKQRNEQQEMEEKKEEKGEDEQKKEKAEGEEKEMEEEQASIDLTKSLTLSKSEIVSNLCDSSLGEEESDAIKENKQNKHNGDNTKNKTDINIADVVNSEKNIEQSIVPNCSRSEDISKENKIEMDKETEAVDVSEKIDETGEDKLSENLNESQLTKDSINVKKTGSDAMDANTVSVEKESEDVAAQVLQEVFDLATAEVQKRHDSVEVDTEKTTNMEEETLENISREIQNSADMPSLDPISGTEADSNDVLSN
ncbi:hypothetical protein KM043_009542 [Ampulex compressa]|nr:hypothetical protein KM043_009542 [Ampulex compressa]